MKFAEILKYDTDPQTMSSVRAFLISLLYMISADGQVQSREIGHLLSVVGSTKTGPLSIQVANQQILDIAMTYRSRNSLETFLLEATPRLSKAQRKCILANLLDCAYLDEVVDQAEKEVFNKFVEAFEIPLDELEPIVEIIKIKNGFAVFGEQYSVIK
ncbi:MAG: TerB family tellurite resistance protein [Acidobacteria bacterium]|nr:TerB family tellurite resistance protein [Acidobacteriota bacterium]